MNSIEVRHITKTYHGQKAIDDVSFEFKSGKIYGLLVYVRSSYFMHVLMMIQHYRLRQYRRSQFRLLLTRLILISVLNWFMNLK